MGVKISTNHSFLLILHFLRGKLSKSQKNAVQIKIKYICKRKVTPHSYE